jgi:hypothetical protein
MARPKSARATISRQLWDAAARCDAHEVRRLLDAGADPNARYQKTTALKIATSMGNMRETRFENGREVVIEYRPLDTVAALLDAGADPDFANGEGWTPLMVAAYSPDLVRLLLTRVKHVDAATKDGFTALMLAATNGHAQSVRLLLDWGANPNHVAADGTTALDRASRSEPVRTVLAAAGGRPGKDLEQGRAAIARKDARERRRQRRATTPLPVGHAPTWPKPPTLRPSPPPAPASARSAPARRHSSKANPANWSASSCPDPK